MAIKNISLPLPSAEYDQDDEATTRRTIEQAIETLAIAATVVLLFNAI